MTKDERGDFDSLETYEAWKKWIKDHPNDPVLQRGKEYADALQRWYGRWSGKGLTEEAQKEAEGIKRKYMSDDMSGKDKGRVNTVAVVTRREREEAQAKEREVSRERESANRVRQPQSLADQIREKGIPQGWVRSGPGPLARRGDARGHYQEHSSGGPIQWRGPKRPDHR